MIVTFRSAPNLQQRRLKKSSKRQNIQATQCIYLGYDRATLLGTLMYYMIKYRANYIFLHHRQIVFLFLLLYRGRREFGVHRKVSNIKHGDQTSFM